MNALLEALPFEFEPESESEQWSEFVFMPEVAGASLLASEFQFESGRRKPPSRRSQSARPQSGQRDRTSSQPAPGSTIVRQAQHRLNQALGLRLQRNGILDAPTRSALRRFQAGARLRATGMLDTRTRAKLAALTGGGGTPPVATLRVARQAATSGSAATGGAWPGSGSTPCRCQAQGAGSDQWPDQGQDQWSDQGQDQWADQGQDQEPDQEPDQGQDQGEYW